MTTDPKQWLDNVVSDSSNKKVIVNFWFQLYHDFSQSNGYIESVKSMTMTSQYKDEVISILNKHRSYNPCDDHLRDKYDAPIYTVHDNFISTSHDCNYLPGIYNKVFSQMGPPLTIINEFIYSNIIEQAVMYHNNREILSNSIEKDSPPKLEKNLNLQIAGPPLTNKPSPSAWAIQNTFYSLSRQLILS